MIKHELVFSASAPKPEHCLVHNFSVSMEAID